MCNIYDNEILISINKIHISIITIFQRRETIRYLLKHSLFDVESAILSEAGSPDTHITKQNDNYNQVIQSQQLSPQNAKLRSREGKNYK